MKKVTAFVLLLLLPIVLMAKDVEDEVNNQSKNETKMRIRIKELEPHLYGLMQQFDKYLQESELSKTHQELIKIRASQLNNCGYCLNLHSKDALKNGEDETRIYMLPLWKKVPMFYTDEEQIILQMTEEITLISEGLSDEVYEKAIATFSKNYVAQIIMAVTVINAWNRIGVATHMEDECSL